MGAGLRLLVLVALVLLGTAAPASAAHPSEDVQAAGPRPPLTPRWVYEPWAWEDSVHTTEVVRELVNGYRSRDIPLGAVILDSPWETNYNTFEFGPDYPDPAALIGELHGQGVRVLLWVTSFINVSSTDGPEKGKATNYDEALAAGYFVNGGAVFRWSHGRGSAIDVFNPRAVAWLYAQLDKAFGLGVDGWKVDNAEIFLVKSEDGTAVDRIETAAGPKTRQEYSDAYYRAFYRYAVERNPEAIIMARPYDAGAVYAPVDANPAGWVGDQGSDWNGLQKAFGNIVESAKRGYAVVGSDIGGRGKVLDAVFVRWIQLGALSPLMENGGSGEHRPWARGERVVPVYRYYAKLHRQLIPYLYSAGVEATATGTPIIRDARREAAQYLLGEDLLVAPILTPDDQRDLSLPDGRWYDYWDDERVLSGPASLRYAAPAERIPLFIRGGAIIPMRVEDAETGHGGVGSAGRLTLLVYPDGESARVYHPEAGSSLNLRSRRDAAGTMLWIDPSTERYALRIKEPNAPQGVNLGRGELSTTLPSLASWDLFDAADEGWYYDAERHQLWVRFAADGTDARISYTAPAPDRAP